MKKHSKTEDLLKILGRQSSPVTAPASKLETPAKHRATSEVKTGAPRTEKRKGEYTRTPPTARVRGKAIQFYLHAPDEKLIRELAVWLAPHRKRINDSLVIKAALRATKTGPELLAAYDAAVKVDGRTRRKGSTHDTA
jgi:hypothetical protein